MVHSKQTCSINTRTDVQAQLPTSVQQPSPHCNRNIPYSQDFRIEHICSSVTDFKYSTNDLSGRGPQPYLNLYALCARRHTRLRGHFFNLPIYLNLLLPLLNSNSSTLLSFSLSRLHVIIGLPTALVPSGLHSKATKVSLPYPLRSTCPVQFHRLLLIP